MNFKHTNGLLEIVIPATVSQETPTLTFKALSIEANVNHPEEKKRRKSKAEKEKVEEEAKQ